MKRFKKIFIEITNACNLNCSYCSSTNRITQTISIESFKHIINEIEPYSDYIYLHVKGEPFLHPNLKALLEICANKNIHVNITTNGTLINNVKDMLLQAKVRQVNFSLHSFDLTQTTDNKIQSVLDILNFTKEANTKTNIIIALRLWNLENNKTTEEIAKNQFILNLLEKEFELPDSFLDKYSAGNSIKIKERIYLNFDNEFNWPNENDDIISDKGFCYALRDQVAILADGTVVPCCLDGNGIINLGNIHMQSFESIINSERAKKIHDGFSDNKAVEDLCKRCMYKERF